MAKAHQHDCVGDVMHKWKHDTLHSGKKWRGKEPGKPVSKGKRGQKQAVAIAISECKKKGQYAEFLEGLGFSEYAAESVSRVYDFATAEEEADKGPLSDVDATPGKQRGNSGRRKQPQQGSQATFPTVPHAETTTPTGTQSTACPPKKTDAEKQAEKAQKGTQPAQPTAPKVPEAEKPAPAVKTPEQAAEAERKRQQREECKKMQGN